MSCSDFERECIEKAGRDLSPSCVEHLLGCASCRKTNERALVVAQLLHLKTYEQPDPSFSARNPAAIRQLLESEPAPSSRWMPWGGLAWRPWQAVAAAAALVVVVLGGIRMVGTPSTVPDQEFAVAPAPVSPALARREVAPPPVDVDSVAIPQAQHGALARDEKPIILFEAPTHYAWASNMQYGAGMNGLPTVPVNFNWQE